MERHNVVFLLERVALSYLETTEPVSRRHVQVVVPSNVFICGFDDKSLSLRSPLRLED